MRCPECGGQIRTKVENLEVFDKLIGPYCVGEVEYRICSGCGTRFYPADTARKIGERRQEQLQRILQQRPISEYSTSTEAAYILGVSRQALHKNRRVRNGFIYGTHLGGKPVYLRSSVMQFKRTGDGRFRLRPITPDVTYMRTIRQQEPEAVYPAPVEVGGKDTEWYSETREQQYSATEEVLYV